MSAFRYLVGALFLVLAAFGSAGCDSTGSGGEEEEPPSESEALATAWKRPYQIAGGVRLAPKPVGDSLVLFGAEARLMALRAEDGSVKWRSPRVEPSTLELKGYTLVVGDGAVFGSHVGRAKAWSLRNGNELWTLNPKGGFNELGYYSLGPNHLYAGGGGQLLVISQESGSVVRKHEFGAAGITYEEGVLYLGQAWTPEGAQGQSQGAILKVDAATGDSLWFFKTERGGFYDGSPIVEDGRVYAGTQGGENTVFVALDAETGEVIWRNEDAPTFAPPAHGPERIYLNTSSKVMALSKETGRTLWTKKVSSGSGFRGVTYLDGYVYHPRGGTLYVLDAETGEIVHEEPSPSSYYWTLAAGPERIYAQTSGHLVAYEPFQAQ